MGRSFRALFALRFILLYHPKLMRTIIYSSMRAGVDINKFYAQIRHAMYNYDFTTLFKYNVLYHYVITILM